MSTTEQWHVDPHLPVLVVDSDGNCVASSFIGVPGCPEALAKAEARARLLAHAPEMAKALRGLHSSLMFQFKCVGMPGFTEQTLHQMRACAAILSKL